MVKVKTSSILKEAVEIKGFVEKNGVLPKTCTLNDGQTFDIYHMTFYMCNVLLKQRVEMWTFVEKVGKYNTVKFKDKLNNVKVSNSRYMDMVKRFVTYCRKNGRVPSNIMVNGEYGASSFELFAFCVAKILAFYHQKNTLPSYCVFNKTDVQGKQSTTSNTKKKTTSSTSEKAKTTNSSKHKKSNCENPYTSTPHYTERGCNKLGQCTGYFCGPHSIHQALKKFGISKYGEGTLASWCGTTRKGTDHQGISTCIAKVSKNTGIKLTTEWKNFSDMGKTSTERFANIGKLLCRNDTAVIWHIAYINGGNSTNGKHFGHYETIDKVNISTDYVRALNSLGDRNNNGSYQGKLQDRPFSVQSYFARNTPGGQSALCIIRRK